jgi:hypothetical protein
MSEIVRLPGDRFLPQMKARRVLGELSSLSHFQTYLDVTPGADRARYDRLRGQLAQVRRGEVDVGGPDLEKFYSGIGQITAGRQFWHVRAVRLPTEYGGMDPIDFELTLRVLEYEKNIIPNAQIKILPYDDVQTPRKLEAYGADPARLARYQEGLATENPYGAFWWAEGGAEPGDVLLSAYKNREPQDFEWYTPPTLELAGWIVAWERVAGMEARDFREFI